MLPRPLRLLWDTSPPGGVVLSSFRSRDPEEGGGPSGRGGGGGQEEEDDDDDDEVRRGRHVSRRLSPLRVCVPASLPASALAAPLAGVGPCPPAGSPGVSEVLCGTDTQEPAPFAHGACGWLACGSLALSARARVARPSGRGV